MSGALLAVALAIALSPLSPLGPIRAVYHPPGVAADWTVLGFGLLVLIGGLGAIALVLAYRGAPHRLATRNRGPLRDSRLLQVVTSSGVPASGAVGVRFALQSGRGRTSVPARSVLVGATLAVVIVTMTLTFSSGLHTLVSRPALYGWNWSYALTSENVVPPQALAALNRDRDVAGWTGYHNLSVQIDGQTVPALLANNNATVAPPILSGHAVDGNNQMVLGPSTLAQLHKRVGDTVIGSFGTPNTAPLYIPPFKLVIVGTATLPAIGGASNFADHPSMGTGAVISDRVSPAFLHGAQDPDPNLDGPGIVFVRLRNGVSTAAGLADMKRLAALSDKVFASDPNATGDSVEVLGVQHPLEIVNYQSTGATPVILAAGLAGGAIVALALTLIASVRRRRRDLALLKTLGFTSRQLAATIAWQASVVAAIAALVGLPVGIAAGRQLWTFFAQSINAVPEPTVPASLFLVAAGVLILANLVALVPARVAARTPPPSRCGPNSANHWTAAARDQAGAAPMRRGTSPKGSRWYASDTRWYPSAMSPPSPAETTSTGLSFLPETALSRSRRTPGSSNGNASRLQARKMSLARRRVTSAFRSRATAAVACLSSNFSDRYAIAASKSWGATSSSHRKPSVSAAASPFVAFTSFFAIAFSLPLCTSMAGTSCSAPAETPVSPSQRPVRAIRPIRRSCRPPPDAERPSPSRRDGPRRRCQRTRRTSTVRW